MLASSIVIILIQNIYISLYCCYFIRALAVFKKPSINISVFLNLAMLWKAGNSQVGRWYNSGCRKSDQDGSGQGAVYVRSLTPLESEDKCETDEELENPVLDRSPRYFFF